MKKEILLQRKIKEIKKIPCDFCDGHTTEDECVFDIINKKIYCPRCWKTFENF